MIFQMENKGVFSVKIITINFISNRNSEVYLPNILFVLSNFLKNF